MTRPGSSADEEFPFYGGRVCLNLVATFGKRHSAAPIERLPDVAAVRRWLRAAGALPGQRDCPVDERRRESLIELREAIHRIVVAARAGESLPADDLATVNTASAGPEFVPSLPRGRGGRGVTWTSSEPFASALTLLARDAIDLVATVPASRIKECEHPDCSRMFVDESQSGRRRWCSMQACGNHVKVTAHRRRAATTR
jgi:predicted RNA-binding Zn ribbon-like protein